MPIDTKPSPLWTEFWIWFALVWPVLFTNISQTGMGLTDISFLGHYEKVAHGTNGTENDGHGTSLSTMYVGAASMGNVWNSLMNVLVVKGIISASQILISQSLGAKNSGLARIYLKVCIVLVTICAVPILCSYIWAGELLNSVSNLGENLTQLTTSYTRILAVGFLPFIWYQSCNSYLVSHQVVRPQMYLSLLCFVLNVVFNIALLYGVGGWHGLGFAGSPSATVGSRCVLCLGGYIIVRQLSVHSSVEESSSKTNVMCAGVTRMRLKKMLWLGLPLSLSMLLEDGQLQFIAILAARIGKISIATHNSMLNFVWVLTSMMWAVSGATRVRLAFYLGAGDVTGAKRVIKIASVCGIGLGTLIASTFILLRKEIGHLFSNDPEVWHLATKISTLCGVGYLALVIFYINMATLAAQGRPMIIALSFVMGAWVCCIPLAIFLAFHYAPTEGLFGLWVALATGYGITTVLSLISVLYSDWDAIVASVLKNAEVYEPIIQSRRSLDEIER